MTRLVAIAALLTILVSPALAAPGRGHAAARAAWGAHLDSLVRLQVATETCRDPTRPLVEELLRLLMALGSAVAAGETQALMSEKAVERAFGKARERAQARYGSRCRPLAPLQARRDVTHRRFMAALRKLYRLR